MEDRQDMEQTIDTKEMKDGIKKFLGKLDIRDMVIFVMVCIAFLMYSIGVKEVRECNSYFIDELQKCNNRTIVPSSWTIPALVINETTTTTTTTTVPELKECIVPECIQDYDVKYITRLTREIKGCELQLEWLNQTDLGDKYISVNNSLTRCMDDLETIREALG